VAVTTQIAAALAGEACASKPGAQRVGRKSAGFASGTQEKPPPGGADGTKPSGHCVATGSTATPKASTAARPRPKKEDAE